MHSYMACVNALERCFMNYGHKLQVNMCLCSFVAAKDYEMEIIWQASRNPSPFREKIFGIGSSLQGEMSGLEHVCVCV